MGLLLKDTPLEQIVCLITKTYLYDWEPLNPFLYSKTGVYRGIYTHFLLLKNIDCGYSLETTRRSGFNEYPQSMFLAEIYI